MFKARVETRMDANVERKIADWVIAEGLRGSAEAQLLAGICERMVAAGLRIMRANIGQRTLHPTVVGSDFEWRRDMGGPRQDDWRRDVPVSQEDLSRFPFYHMHINGLERLRVRLVRPNADFPLLETLRSLGATDYLALTTTFGEGDARGPLSGFDSSWATDAPEGFSDADIATIEHLLQPLALSIKATSTYRSAKSVLATYLGRDAGNRVLSGEITRGSAETISAVLWYADLQGFTKIADSTSRDQLITMLNDYFGCMVEAVHEHGGHVLKFIGDGLLAIFRLDEDANVCSSALGAAEGAFAAVHALNARRAREGQATTKFYLGLHLGDVLYGNVGGQDRLDFTVVGPAVNEVSRIESMCRSLEQDLVISSAFAEAAGACTDRIVSLGRYALRGVSRPQELFTLAPKEPGLEAPAELQAAVD